jgi:precorrin-8X/cobalt-precorrin-8 methylmutase
VARAAKERGLTRSFVGMAHALAIQGPRLFVCGNAPTFLLSLLASAEKDGIPADTAVVGVPVGFVNVVEAKERIMRSGVPFICSRGRKGGSNVAAAIINAILYRMERQ